jgi:hypothetical protein
MDDPNTAMLFTTSPLVKNLVTRPMIARGQNRALFGRNLFSLQAIHPWIKG